MQTLTPGISGPAFDCAVLSGHRRILVVDDQPTNIRALDSLFRDDYEVLGTTSGRQAIDLCRQQPPDLVLLDIVMPDLDGYEVCQRLKADPRTREISIIFLTSKDSSDDEALGFELGAVDYIAKPFSPSVVRARVLTHLVLKAQADMLRSLAFVDGLTGIANRRLFDHQIDLEWRACRRSGSDLSVLMFDIDHFKLFNDSNGHQEGDRCLRSVARALQQRLGRARDLFARYGGEEFACVLPETDTDGACAKATTMLEAVERLGIPHRSSPTADLVTVSIGVATGRPAAGGSATDLVASADRQLYRAKRAGRNQFSLGTDDGWQGISDFNDACLEPSKASAQLADVAR